MNWKNLQAEIFNGARLVYTDLVPGEGWNLALHYPSGQGQRSRLVQVSLSLAPEEWCQVTPMIRRWRGARN